MNSYIHSVLSGLKVILLLFAFITSQFAAESKKPDSAFDAASWKKERELLSAAELSENVQAAEIYLKLAELFKDHEKELEYLDLAEKAAAETRYSQLPGTIKLARLEHYSIYEDTELFLNYAREVREYMSVHKDRRLANTEYIIIKRHIDEGRTQTALSSAQNMLKKAEDFDKYSQAYAYLSLGLIYVSVKQEREATHAFEKSIRLMEALGKDFPQIDRIKTWLELLGIQYNIGRYPESVESCRKADALLTEYIENKPSDSQADINRKSMRLYIQSYLIRNYVAMKELDKAAKHMELGRQYIYENIGPDLETYNEACAIYYKETGQYNLALDYIDRSIEAFRGKQLFPYYLDALDLKTKILAAKGDWENAYNNLVFICHAEDSLNTTRFATQAGELHTIYEVDKIKFQKKRQQSLIIFSLMFCTLLTFLVAVYIVYSQRLKRKNKSLYNQIASNVRDKSHSAKVLQLAPEESLSKEMSLFRKISAMMEEDNPFTDPSFGRSALVKMTCSNDKYVADAIREGAGVTVATYISDLRLNYSLELLTDENYNSLDEVARLSGFGSYSSFFRTFQKKYSITPSEYQNYAKTNSVINQG